MQSDSISSILDLSNQVALITGASRGIGRGIAEVFKQAGARLALVARSPGPLEEVADNVATGKEDTSVLALPADIAVEDQVNRVVEETVSAFGTVDILVNNAGLMSPGPYTEIDLEEWNRVLFANLTGAYLCCRAVGPMMEEQRSGRIINIASISGQTGGVSGGAHYSSSKGGMIAMTKTLARDLAPSGVTVNAITPGVIETSFDLSPEARQRVQEMVPLGRIGSPEDIAYAALFLASPMASYITGATIDVNGGLLKR
ncbi:MAG: SDR family NAD(P)-dependent oxidoreductase [Candidatus Latescibacteria bacterium]|nr:SDR family NAD(P)-dependent oxidoreductase [Candidatus Latescibacterota bacterium]